MGVLDFLLSNPDNKPKEKSVEQIRQESHDAKNDLQRKLFKVQQELDEKNKRSNVELEDISKKIGDIADSIATATGRQKHAT